jgi:hypothetical protein
MTELDADRDRDAMSPCEKGAASGAGTCVASLEEQGGGNVMSKKHYSQRTRLSVIAGLAAGGLLGFGALGEPRADDENELELKGTVSELSGTCPELEFTVNNQTVTTDENTDFDDAACSEVRDGGRVEIEAKPTGQEGQTTEQMAEGEPLEQPALTAEEVELR